MYYIRVTEGINEILNKDGKMRISILIFIYTIHFAYLKVAPIGAEQSLTEISIGEKAK